MFDIFSNIVFGKRPVDLRWADLRGVREVMGWGTSELDAVDIIFEYRSDDLSDKLHLSPVGAPLAINYRGNATVQMAGNKLVVTSAERPDLDQLIMKLSEDSVDLMLLFEHIPEVQSADLAALIQQAAKDNLERLLNEAVADMAQNLQEEKRLKKEQYDRALLQMRNAYAEYLKYNFTMEEDYRKSLRETLEREIALIQDHKKVKKVEFTSGGLNIYTTDLIMYEPHANTHYFLGSMRISFRLGQYQEIRFFNQTKTVDAFFQGAHHPHVDNGGYPCLGNIETQMHQYLVERQYYAAFITALGYLQTANVEDVAGRSITRWDKCTADGTILEKADPSEGEWDDDEEYDEEEEQDFNEAATGEMWCTVCDGLLDEQSTRCTMCDSMAHNHCGMVIEGRFICEDCLDNSDVEDLYYCNICNTYHLTSSHPYTSMTFKYGNTEWVCEEHAPDVGWCCQNCNEWFHNEVESRPGELGPCCLESCL